MEVRDILANPPKVDPYDKLCSPLKARFGASFQQSLEQLVKDEGLGDRKPSQLLCHLHYLLSAAGPISEAVFLRPLFLQRLPANVRAALSTLQAVELDDMAQAADQCFCTTCSVSRGKFNS